MKTYRETWGRGPDFVVTYRLYAPAEGGRQVTYQHLRCDFSYEGDDPAVDGIYMIHPEFLDEFGDPRGDDAPVSLEGRASMWIIIAEMRGIVHRARVALGCRGYFMEGSRRIGEAVVDEIVDLFENPI